MKRIQDLLFLADRLECAGFIREAREKRAEAAALAGQR